MIKSEIRKLICNTKIFRGHPIVNSGVNAKYYYKDLLYNNDTKLRKYTVTSNLSLIITYDSNLNYTIKEIFYE